MTFGGLELVERGVVGIEDVVDSAINFHRDRIAFRKAEKFVHHIGHLQVGGRPAVARVAGSLVVERPNKSKFR